jgi:hypothetical protein
MKLIIENVRCFAGPHEAEIKPLTLLVGENSTGKTSFLACLSAVLKPEFPFIARLNDPPYNLGGFETIASGSERNGDAGRSFSVGYDDTASTGSSPLKLTAEFRGPGWRSSPSRIEFQVATARLTAEFAPGVDEWVAYVEVERGGTNRRERMHVGAAVPRDRDILALAIKRPFSTTETEMGPGGRRRPVGMSEEAEISRTLGRWLRDREDIRDRSVAPIRSRPERTYEQKFGRAEYDAEGEYVPDRIREILSAKDAHADEMSEALRQFGVDSGLFERIEFRQFGESAADPFQLRVHSGLRSDSILDVGYGVSQALPVFVAAVTSDPRTTLLVQQPEVRLHPRAQAGLGSFFAKRAGRDGKGFVVETHSDYIIDRIRQEVAAGTVACDSVGILYFEKCDDGVKIYPISLDEVGNVIDAPPGYRSFFLQEEMNLLSRGL